jgi:hypothetical protein|tara:strand:+ start:488 stop:1501 length:1014 start_codon:yes stop_codon:yes gene_type:complete
MTTIYKTYEQMKKASPDGGAYLDWARDEVADKEGKGIYCEYDHKNANGSTTKVLSQFNTKVSKDRIDGHFWLEDMNGNLVSDCGFHAYKHKLPCFNNLDFYNPDTDFIVYQPVPDAKMEQEIIDAQVSQNKRNWGAALNFEEADGAVGYFEDPRTVEERFKVVARQMWKEKARMLERGFECLQHAVAERLYRTETLGEEVRIRFGCAGVVSPLRDEVFWFFGHLDNTKIGEWIVKDAVSADGKSEKPVIHDRKMRIRQVPNALAEMNERARIHKEEKAAETLYRKRKMEQNAILKASVLKQETVRADKAMAELLAELEDEPQQKKQKKSNKKKKKNV